jgi:putative ABC transport system permease protein
MNLLQQIFTVSGLNFRNLPRRAWQSLVVVTGMGLAIAVLLSMLSMTVGLRQASGSVGDPGLVLAVTQNVTWEGASSVPRDQARIIMAAPGIAHASDGTLLADHRSLRRRPWSCARMAAASRSRCAASAPRA